MFQKNRRNKMPLTHFPHGLSSMGMPVLGGEGLLTQGTSYFVDPLSGNDGNDGKSIDKAFKSIETGYAALTENYNDVLYYLSGSSSLSTTETLAWTKDYCSLVGVCAGPVALAKRARIFATSTQTDASLVTVSGYGNSFRNIYINYGVASSAALACWTDTSNRNYYENMHISGINNSTQDAAGACSLKLDGGTERLFVNCYIGSDTQRTRAGDSSEILVDTSVSKAFFVSCMVYAGGSDAGHHLVRLADGTAIANIGLWFKDSTFLYNTANNAHDLTEVFDIPTMTGAPNIYLQNCYSFGAASWDAANKNVITNIGADNPTDGDAVNIGTASGEGAVD